MDSSGRSPHTYRFGKFKVDSRLGLLHRQGHRVKLQGQPFQVLLLLLERPGQMVSRDELRNRVWPEDTFVVHPARTGHRS